MRQTILGLATAFALMIAGGAPAMACGLGTCWPCAYGAPCGAVYAPVYAYSSCYSGCVWGFDHLSDPATQYHTAARPTQYYYVNQGPTYSGPGAFAPYPVYEEAEVYSYGRYHSGAWHRNGYYHGRPVLRRYY